MKIEKDYIEVVETFKSTMEGDFLSGVKLLTDFTKLIKSIPDYLFYYNLKTVLDGLDEKGTAKRKVGKKLAKSSYGEEYGYTLFHYINAFEHKEKGEYMANLIDSVSKDFILADECFKYCKVISEVSLVSLIFLKNNIEKRELFQVREKMDIINELLRNNLMYKSYNDGYAFGLEAFYLDKFALSYDTDRYKYASREEGIPELCDFPKIPVHFVTADMGEYRG